MNLALINAWPSDQAIASFLRCCGSRRWSEQMAKARPFESEASVFDSAGRLWWRLSEADWLEAFAAHPQIGDVEAIGAKFATTAAWASREQAGALEASEPVIKDLALENRRYLEKFGFLFIVCATGKTAGDMLAILTQRASNDRDTELKLAAGEQLKITTIRLERIAP